MAWLLKTDVLNAEKNVQIAQKERSKRKNTDMYPQN
jgi:hypothetical protein